MKIEIASFSLSRFLRLFGGFADIGILLRLLSCSLKFYFFFCSRPGYVFFLRVMDGYANWRRSYLVWTEGFTLQDASQLRHKCVSFIVSTRTYSFKKHFDDDEIWKNENHTGSKGPNLNLATSIEVWKTINKLMCSHRRLVAAQVPNRKQAYLESSTKTFLKTKTI